MNPSTRQHEPQRPDSSAERALQAQQTALDALVNEPVDVRIGDVVLQVTPLTMAKLPRILRLARPFLDQIGGIRSAQDVLALLADHGEAITEITAIAAGAPLDSVERLTPDLLAELFLRLVGINADFFAQRLPGLQERLQAGQALLESSETRTQKKTGLTRSPA